MPVKLSDLPLLPHAKPRKPLSKLDAVLATFREYALLAQDWDPKTEDDYKDLKRAIKETLARKDSK